MGQGNFQPKVLCAVSHGLYSPWLEIAELGQVHSWLDLATPENFHIQHFHGTPVGAIGQRFDKIHERIRWTNRWVALPQRFLNNLILWPLRNYIPRIVSSNLTKIFKSNHIIFPDIYLTFKWKDIAIFEYFLYSTEDDFLYMTTSSSYLRPSKLVELLKTLPTTNLYAGAIPYEGANFAAGNNRLFSRDVVEKIVQNREKWSPGVIEDMAIGNLCAALGIIVRSLPRMNIDSLERLDTLSNSELAEYYHFRLKSGTAEKRNDVEIMLELHKRILQIEEA